MIVVAFVALFLFTLLAGSTFHEYRTRIRDLENEIQVLRARIPKHGSDGRFQKKSGEK